MSKKYRYALDKLYEESDLEQEDWMLCVHSAVDALFAQTNGFFTITNEGVKIRRSSLYRLREDFEKFHILTEDGVNPLSIYEEILEDKFISILKEKLVSFKEGEIEYERH